MAKYNLYANVATPSYQVRKSGSGFQVFWVDGEIARPVDGEQIYPQRQGAYRRAKKLNDRLALLRKKNTELSILAHEA